MIKVVDIIVPIYNAYDDLKICVESLFQNTNFKVNRLILVNDNSSDERIKPYLDSLNRENVIVIHNKENRGFSNNVNLGMSQSETNDVILLNSDTIVTQKWVEKILNCAYSSSSIGTVTPLSNNATLCSVPDFCQENTLPDYMTVEEAGALIEKISLKRYPTISVAHGFCMFIKREVIQLVGLFDAETFEKGYGEENDFCNRMIQLGYENVMCDDTYIYHSGTKSFLSKEKEERIAAHDRILRERYPELMHQNDVYCQKNPNFDICENVRLYMNLCNGKRNILYFVQSDFREGTSGMPGGTQLHVRDLVDGLKHEFNVFVMARNSNYLDVTAYTGESVETLSFDIGEKVLFTKFHDRKQSEVISNVLDAFRIQIVHVHHVYGLSLDIYYESKKRNIPIFTTIHDFYTVCPKTVLLNKEMQVCVGRECNEMCQACLHDAFGIVPHVDYLKKWRSKFAEILEMSERIIFPSEAVKEIFEQYYKTSIKKYNVIEHGLDVSSIRTQKDYSNVVKKREIHSNIEKVSMKNPKVISVCGWAYDEKADAALVNVILQVEDENGKTEYIPTAKISRGDVAKGDIKKQKCGFEGYVPVEELANGKLKITVLLECAGKVFTNGNYTFVNKNAKKEDRKLRVAFIGGISEEKGGKQVYQLIKNYGEDINWYLFGGIGYEPLDKLKKSNLVKTGIYKRDDLATLIEKHQIDLICILSICPETFCYTLSEALLCGMPVIATNIGALGERVNKMQCGWTVEVDNIVKSTEQILDRIRNRNEEYLRVKERVEKLKLKSVDEANREYLQLYNTYNMDMGVYGQHDKKMILEAYLLANSNEGDYYDVLRRLNQAESILKSIQSSAAHKLVDKILSCKIPFRSQIRGIFRKLMRTTEL